MLKRSRKRPTPGHPHRGVKRRQKYARSVLRPGKPYRATADEWAILRIKLFERARGFCEFDDCGKVTPLEIGEAHHVVSRAKLGSDVIENLIWSCARCHRRHHGDVQWTKGSGNNAE